MPAFQPLLSTSRSSCGTVFRDPSEEGDSIDGPDHRPSEKDRDGHPPFAAERIWAEEAEGGLYLVDDVPFHARRMALGDLVSADDVDGVSWSRSVQQISMNSTTRVVLFDEGRSKGVEAGLKVIGCDFECFERRGSWAIDVPSAMHCKEFLRLLDRRGGADCMDRGEPALCFHGSGLP